MHDSTRRPSLRRHHPRPPRSRRPRRLASAVAVTPLLALGALAGCGSDDEPAAESSPAPSSDSAQSSESSAPSTSPSAAAATGTTIQVRIEGDRVTPSNDRIEVPTGEPVTVRVVSDRDGELHVHSSPETTFDFGPGTSSKTFTIQRPGLVEMEEHDSDTLVAQLEAR